MRPGFRVEASRYRWLCTPKKTATTVSHEFFANASVSTLKPHAHCPVARRSLQRRELSQCQYKDSVPLPQSS